MKILFAGTPEFSVPALHALCAAGHTVTCALTQPDRPAGRGRQTQPTPVKHAANLLGIPVLQPNRVRDPQALADICVFEAEVMVVVAYGMILPEVLLRRPRYGCLNIHASLLPAWRGAAPIQRALEAGDAQTGITIMQMDATLDTGDILLTKTLPIKTTDTSQTLHDQLSALGAESIVRALAALKKGELTPVPQDHQLATYAHKLEKREAVLDWRLPAQVLANKVSAFNPWPVAQSTLNGIAWRIWAATALTNIEKPSTKSPAGTILASSAQGLRVATGDGELWLTRLQRPGGKPLEVAQLINAFPFQIGDCFESV